MVFVDNDRWAGHFPLEQNARYEFTLIAWRDAFSSWVRDTLKKRAAGVDVRLETIEGVALVETAASLARTRGGRDAERLAALVAALAAEETGSAAQLDRILQPEAASLVRRNAERVNLTRYPVTLPVIADRLAARFSAWYEIFPRSQSMDVNRHGTFDDVIRRLPEIRELGFDVLYFTPIHPMGRTNRKGKNNTLTAEPGDVGSVYAVGAAEGGHEAVHPGPRHARGFRAAGGGEPRLRHGDRPRLRDPVLARPSLDQGPSGMVRVAPRRHDQISPRIPPKKYEDIVNVDFYGGALPVALDRAARHPARSGAPGACASSGSTTRTPSRSRSGNG